MEKINKLIKLLSLLAFFVVVLAVGFSLYRTTEFNFPVSSKNKSKADLAIKNKSAKMLFVGDIMLDRHVGEKIKEEGFDYLFEGLKKDNFNFYGYDLISGNLEGAVTDGGNHYTPAQLYDFAFAPEVVNKLKNYNFTNFNLANNHLADQGERGIKETSANLDELKFYYYGCADGLVEDCSLAVRQVGDLKIGLAGFSMVYKKFDLAAASEKIKDLKDKVDLIIVNVHWGTEYSHIFNKIQQETAHQLIDAGADVIIGHHPHVVQGLELYKNKPIFYSLGNFIFDQYFSADTQEELAVEIDFKTDGQTVARLKPIISKQSQPGFMVGAEKERYLSKIAVWSKMEKELSEQIKLGEIKIIF